MIVAIADTAQAVISRIGWRTVVSSGQMVLAIAVSSKPQTVMSLGPSRWRRCATATVAAAISSFDAKIAVGRGFTISSFSATSNQEREVKGPSTICEIGRASLRERVGQYWEVSVGAGTLQKKK